ncbi:phosphatase PAP2 family protein [Kribbella sp. NPDC054772]
MTSVRRSMVPLIVLGLVLVTVPALVYAGSTRPSRIDGRLQSLATDRSPAAHQLAVALDWLGEPRGRILVILAVAAVCLLARRRALAITAVIASLVVAVLTTGLKYIVDRRIHDGFLSYPSGHAAAFAAIGLVLGLLLADLLRTSLALGTAIVLAATLAAGILMAWSQVSLTAHYPTDTVGGVGCALIVVPAIALLVDRWAAGGAARRP